MRTNAIWPGGLNRRLKVGGTAIVSCVVAVTLAACTSSSSSSPPSGSGSSSTPKASPSAAALGTPNPAAGSTINVGLISDGGAGAGGTFPLLEQGAKVAVQYANEYRGGIAGHKINLVICQNNSTPAGGQNCANQMVKEHVVAVVLPFTGQGQTEVPTIVGAGIPYITLSGASQVELLTKGAFALQGGFPAALGAFALYSKEHSYKKAAFLVTNVPAAVQGANIFGAQVFKNAGVGFQVVPVNPGVADLTPQLQSAISGGADAVGMVGDIAFCSSFLKAYKTLSLTVPRYILATCIDKSIYDSSLESALKGSIVAAANDNSPAELAVYGAMVAKYAAGTDPDPNASTSFASGVTPVFSLLAIMDGYTGDVTAATVLHETETRQNVLIPLSGGLTFTCNGTAIPLLTSVCSAQAVLGEMGTGATVINKKTYDTTPLFK